MTINAADNSPRIEYSVAQGVTQTTFTVPFEFFDTGDINVYVDGVLKVEGSDYTVTGGEGSTGSIIFVVADPGEIQQVTGATGGSQVVITRDIPIERTTDFNAGSDINRAALNEQLDTIIALIADVDDKANRAIQISDYEVAPSLSLPSINSRKGKVLGFNETTGAVESGPTIADVSSLADITADISRLADIEDGTIATDTIQTVSGISSNVTTVAGISGNVTTVAGISSDVTAVAADATDIGTVSSNIANVNTVAGISSAVSTVAADGTDIGVVAGISSDVTTVSGISANVTTVAGISSDVTSVAADATDIGTVSANIGNVNTVAGISGNVTTVAGISANVTAVAGDATDIGTVATSIADVNTVASNIGAGQSVTVVATNISNINAVAADATDIGSVATNIANVNTVAGISANVTTVANNSANVTTVAGISSDVTAVAADATDIGTVATNLTGTNTIGTVAGSISNVNAVGGSISNVNTVATNINNVNDFFDVYRTGTSFPTTNLNAGDLFLNTDTGTLYVYTGSGWTAGVTAGSGFMPTTGGTFTGNILLYADPTNNLGAATKQYVDTIAAAGLHYHAPVRVETDGTLPATYDNGTSGVGATLTNSGTQAALVIDGVTLSVNDRVLIYARTNAFENGVYYVSDTGSASTNWVLTRTTDTDSYGASDPDALGQGDAFFVLEGATGAGELYVMNTQGEITFGTTDITFTQVAATAVYSAGTGLTLTGTEFAAAQDIATSASPTFAGLTVNGAITSTSDVSASNFSTTGNMTFGDNNKAIFGAGSDLQIYHDGLHSYVKDNGTGDLKLQGNNLYLQNASGETYLGATSDGLVFLRYDNATKLSTTSTGIDVTGTVTADGLTVDGDVSVIKAISYGGSADIDFVLGASNVGGGVNDSKALAWRWKVAGNQNGQLLDLYEIYDNGATNAERKTLTFNGGGDISFYDSLGSSQKFFWDASAEALGIGTSSPTEALSVSGNISVTGTVDGRDVAADGTKLDGIEAGATADQTAAEILTAIKTVDGAGSGLDADLLDGQQGSYYQPASTAITTSNISSQSVNYATSAGSVGNADTTDGYHVSTTRNAANTIPVRDGNGYLQLGWINTTSGSTGSFNKIYASNDDYMRYVTPATLVNGIGVTSWNTIGSYNYAVYPSYNALSFNSTASGIYSVIQNHPYWQARWAGSFLDCWATSALSGTWRAMGGAGRVQSSAMNGQIGGIWVRIS